MVSPESMVRMGGRLASNTPSRTVSRVDGTTYTRPSPWGWRRGGLFRPCEPGEPRLDRGERAHEAAGLKELAAPATAFRQIAVERFLIDLVHVEEAIGGAIIEGSVLDVLADNANALLVAAAEEISAGVMVMPLLVSVIVL
jgi:hypothetical protein